MSWLLFVDEPSDRQFGFPYGTLTGIAVEDAHLWALARGLREAQHQFFGRQLANSSGQYMDASVLLGAQVFEIAQLHSDLGLQSLSQQLRPEAGQLTGDAQPIASALARAKIAYCEFCIELARDFGAVAFAMFIPVDAITVRYENRLRKDYSYLFERFHYFLMSKSDSTMGLIVLPHGSQSSSYVSPHTVLEYFANTTAGRLRARRIVPSSFYADGPLHVVSHLAQIVAYVASWSVRLPDMHKPRRIEMSNLASLCMKMRYSYLSENGKKDWSFKSISNLEPSTLASGRGWSDQV